jgi:hypothetical protein
MTKAPVAARWSRPMARKAVKIDRIPEGGRRSKLRIPSRNFSVQNPNFGNHFLVNEINGRGTGAKIENRRPLRQASGPVSFTVWAETPLLVARAEAEQILGVPAETFARYIRDGRLRDMAMQGPALFLRSDLWALWKGRPR